MDVLDFKEKCVLVTGASRGIGLATARLFHKQNAYVALHGTRRETLENLSRELGERSSVFSGSLADRTLTKQLIKDVEEKFGHLDILVCNAGITRDRLGVRLRDEDWDDVIAINLTANFLLIRGAIEGMMKRRYGRIIAVSSVVGLTGNPGQANYCASKAGLIGMVKGIAQEVAARNITVNCVAPGFIQTDMTDKLTDKQKLLILEKIPMGKIGSANDIAEAIMFLSSQKASYITGQTIHVNGGMAML